MIRKLLMMFVALIALNINVFAQSNSYGLPEGIQDGNILHCFNWTFNDIKKELPQIAQAGFGSIQVSPVQGCCASNAEWFYAYMPYDFCFRTNGNGSRDQLKSLCAEAEKYGIKIIVDVVANHINQASGYHDPWWDSNGRIRWNGRVDYNNRYSITHNQLGEYGDVNSEDAQVQARAKAFIEDLKSLGVKGIRWDAAKHIGLPSENCAFWPQVCGVAGMWHYGEILDGPGGDTYRLLKEYTDHMSVTDSEYSSWVLNELTSGKVPFGAVSWGSNGVPRSSLVYWGESHDTYSNDGQYGRNTAHDPQGLIDRAWAIGACRRDETSLYFSRPSATTRNNIRMGQKGSTHFTSKEIAAVNHFRNAMVGTDEAYVGENGIATITRAGGGACIVIGAGGSRNVTVTNAKGYVPAGAYVDKVSGNSFTVTASTITGQVGPTGIAVIYGEVTREPKVTFNPAGGNFTDKVTVKATVTDATDAWYRIGDGATTSITSTASFTIGADMNPGESVTIAWGASDAETTNTGSVTFTKVEQPSNIIYYDNTLTRWTTPHIHYWGETGSKWPGVAMEKHSDDVWKYVVPEGTTGCLFNAGDGDATKTGDFKAVAGHIYNRDGDQGVYNGSNIGGGDDNVDAPSALFILGNLKNASWLTDAGVEMEREGNCFVAYSVEFVSTGIDGICYFNLTDRLAPSWDDLNTRSNRWGASGEGTVVSLGKSGDMIKYAASVNASACKSWKIAEGKYDIVADFAKMTVTPRAASAVESVDADAVDLPVRYFNLQGMKVANPSGGIFIRCQGNRVTKVRL